MQYHNTILTKCNELSLNSLELLSTTEYKTKCSAGFTMQSKICYRVLYAVLIYFYIIPPFYVYLYFPYCSHKETRDIYYGKAHMYNVILSAIIKLHNFVHCAITVIYRKYSISVHFTFYLS